MFPWLHSRYSMQIITLLLLLIVAQGRRAVKRGTLRSCQQAKDLIRVNTSHWPEKTLLYNFLIEKYYCPVCKWAVTFSLLCCSPTPSTFPCSHYAWRSFTRRWWLIKLLPCASAPGSRRSSVTQVLPSLPPHKFHSFMYLLCTPDLYFF